MHSDSSTGGVQIENSVSLSPVQGDDGQWSVGMLMEEATLTDRNDYQYRLARAKRKGLPAAAVEDDAIAYQQLCQQIQQLLQERRQDQHKLQQTQQESQHSRHKLQQTQQQLQQTQQELQQIQQELQQTQQKFQNSQHQLRQLQEQVSDMLIVDSQIKNCLHLCATIIACNRKQ